MLSKHEPDWSWEINFFSSVVWLNIAFASVVALSQVCWIYLGYFAAGDRFQFIFFPNFRLHLSLPSHQLQRTMGKQFNMCVTFAHLNKINFFLSLSLLSLMSLLLLLFLLVVMQEISSNFTLSFRFLLCVSGWYFLDDISLWSDNFQLLKWKWEFFWLLNNE